MTSSPSINPLEIRSAGNDRFRRLLALTRSARERRQSGLTVIEGEHLFQVWLDVGQRKLDEAVLPRRSIGRGPLVALCERVAKRMLVLDDALYDRLSQVEHGPGPLSVMAVPTPALPDLLDDDAVYLDGVQDPGNAGTVMRSALAFGVRRLIGSPETVGLWSPKVLRAGMGAHFGLVVHENVPAASLLQRCDRVRATAAEPRAALSLGAADFRVPRVWIFGAEGRGVSETLAQSAQIERVSIPHSDAVESLNVAVAASLCLYEQYRARGR